MKINIMNIFTINIWSDICDLEFWMIFVVTKRHGDTSRNGIILYYFCLLKYWVILLTVQILNNTSLIASLRVKNTWYNVHSLGIHHLDLK